jgi:hypothetical protein
MYAGYSPKLQRMIGFATKEKSMIGKMGEKRWTQAKSTSYV